MDKKFSKNLIRLTVGILIVLGIWYLVKCQCVDLRSITPSAIRDYIQSFGKLSAIIYILAYSLNTISIFPPIAGLSLAAGLIFGKLWGAVFLMTGALLGTSCTFFISKFFGRNLAEKLMKGKFKDLDDLLEKRGFLTVLFFRLVPLVPYEVLNYASGLSKIRFRDYFLATFIGLIPGVIISAFFGGALGSIKNIKDLLSPEFLIAVGALLIIIMVPIIYRYIKKRKEK